MAEGIALRDRTPSNPAPADRPPGAALRRPVPARATRSGARRGVRRALLLAAGAALAALLVGCGDSGSDGDATPTSDPGSGSTAADAIRRVDFTDPAIAGPLIDRAGGGEVLPERIVYDDLDGDGAEEAVVVVESGGTAGDLAAGIFRVGGESPQLVYFAQAGGRVDVRLGVVVFQSGIWAPGDAACCPSQLREIGVAWDGDAFTEISDQVVDAPAS